MIVSVVDQPAASGSDTFLSQLPDCLIERSAGGGNVGSRNFQRIRAGGEFGDLQLCLPFADFGLVEFVGGAGGVELVAGNKLALHQPFDTLQFSGGKLGSGLGLRELGADDLQLLRALARLQVGKLCFGGVQAVFSTLAGSGFVLLFEAKSGVALFNLRAALHCEGLQCSGERGGDVHVFAFDIALQSGVTGFTTGNQYR